MKTKDRWYENATFYAIDVEAFADGDAEATLELAHESHALFGGRDFEQTENDDAGTWHFELDRYGYCWIRVEEGI